MRFFTALLATAALAVPATIVCQDSQAHTPQHHHYKLIELGTFGGPSRYVAIDNGVNGAVNQVINSSGTVAGWADTSTPDPYAPNCLNPDCFVSHAFNWQNDTMTDLGVLPGGQNSSAAWISDAGLIAGQSQNGLIDPLHSWIP